MGEPNISSDEDMDDAPKPALPLTLLNAPTNGPPMTPEQYLAAVHSEAQAMPRVIAANHFIAPTVKLADSCPSPKPILTPLTLCGVVPPPPHALPHSHWRRRVAIDYAQLQATLLCLSPPSVVVSQKGLPQTAEQWRSQFVSNIPTMTFLRRLDFLSIARALAALDDSIPFDADAALSIFHPSQLPLWIFCLLAFVQPPLDPDTSATVRSILQKAALARSVTSSQELDTIATLNVIITILGDHFGQSNVH